MGGVLNPVPIAPTFSDITDLTIAVNLGGKVEDNGEVVKNEVLIDEVKSPYSEKIAKFVGGLKGLATTRITNEWGAYDIANQAFDAMQSTIARQKLAAYPADYFIEIARNACGTLEFDLASEMITLGYEKAEESLSEN
ncbi:FIG00613342: Bacterial patatin-like phospholipase domain containing protein [hydrothermal vent metagenome]|uniref:FIG00613342: Bacterial patatin-like phospholipase domain containing protein n=1 Tax=hydrothermal vent metagenome TaxID=652676 RepID=A0A3B0VYQ6_9ZZZZ